MRSSIILLGVTSQRKERWDISLGLAFSNLPLQISFSLRGQRPGPCQPSWLWGSSFVLISPLCLNPVTHHNPRARHGSTRLFAGKWNTWGAVRSLPLGTFFFIPKNVVTDLFTWSFNAWFFQQRTAYTWALQDQQWIKLTMGEDRHTAVFPKSMAMILLLYFHPDDPGWLLTHISFFSKF